MSNHPFEPPPFASSELKDANADSIQDCVVRDDHPKKGSWLTVGIAWFVVLAFVVFQVAMLTLPDDSVTSLDKKSGAFPVVEMQGKYMLGGMSLLDGQELPLDAMNAGPIDHRFAYAIMVNEVDGPEEGQAALDEIDELVAESDFNLPPSHERVQGLLRIAFQDHQNEAYELPSISDDDKAFLKARMGWYSELLMTPVDSFETERRESLESSAQRLFVFLIIGVLGVMAATGFGSICLGASGIYGLYQYLTQKKLPQFKTKDHTNVGSVYIEAFAIWIVMFLLISLALAYVIKDEGSPLALFAKCVGAMMTITCVFWPVIRGVSFGKVCEDIGWRAKNPLTEVGWGFVGYLLTLPVLAMGFLATLILINLSGAGDPNDLTNEPMSHPAVEWVTGGNGINFLLVALLTVVQAPLLEETVFRGLLYRHLRNSSVYWGRYMSILFAAVFNAIVFAAIHPQGIMAIPVLASLAFSFSLVREWRGSLVAPMTMHAIHNGLITMTWIVMFV